MTKENLEEIRQSVFEKVEAERLEFDQSEPEAGQETSDLFSTDEILKALSANEDGDAWLFVELQRDRFVYDHAAGTWFKWAGNYWAEDLLNEAMANIENVISVYGRAAQQKAWLRIKDQKSGNEEIAKIHEKNESVLIKRIRSLQTLNRKKNVLELAKIGTEGLGITGEEWDRDPWLLAVKNGVIDLRTGLLRPGQPDDYIKTVAPVEWRRLRAPAPTWEQFLSGIFDGNKELVNYIHRLLGYCTTGLTVEHIFPIFHGAGRNGKGTLFEAMAYVLGPYAGPTEAELILKQKMTRQSGGPTSDIMYLRGKRCIWISETDEGRQLNAGKVKLLTGGDSLTGRGVYGRRQINFRSSHKLILLTNHRPYADPSDYALFQRLHLVPFTLSFVDNPDPLKTNERKADKNILEKLKAEAPGILAWLVRGCLAWQREGLNPPETVWTATKAYQEEEDLIAQFISDRCALGPDLEVQAGTLYKAYQEWAEENGLKPNSNVKFGREIQKRFESYKDHNTFYKGVALR